MRRGIQGPALTVQENLKRDLVLYSRAHLNDPEI